MSIRKLFVPRNALAATIDELSQRGQARTERVALWLAGAGNAEIKVAEIYVPQYSASPDYFEIPRPAMAKLLQHLGDRGFMIGAQLHTHPLEAFHSRADDKWAIVRHVGALSIVLPHFAKTVTSDNFITLAKFFTLSAQNQWLEIPPRELNRYVEVVL